MRIVVFLPMCILACTDVSSEEDAEAAYLGLDLAVDRGLSLGMDGYNAASSANIDDQEEGGDTSGSMLISGQVDQGSSDNKGLRLSMALTDYSDTEDEDGEPDLVYDTEEGAPAEFDLQLRNIPDGTLEGTLVGSFAMDGRLTGTVELDLDIEATLESDPDEEGAIRRVEGSTTVTGAATSDYGEFEVSVTR